MELKRILAKDIRRATEKAVALYGKDVLFVSNARVNGMTEVIVAVEVMPDAPLEPQALLQHGPQRVLDFLRRGHRDLPPGAAGAGAVISSQHQRTLTVQAGWV